MFRTSSISILSKLHAPLTTTAKKMSDTTRLIVKYPLLSSTTDPRSPLVKWSGSCFSESTKADVNAHIAIVNTEFIVYPSKRNMEAVFQFSLDFQFKGLPNAAHSNMEPIWADFSLVNEDESLLYSFGQMIRADNLDYYGIFSKGQSSPDGYNQIWHNLKKDLSVEQLEKARLVFKHPQQISFFNNSLKMKAEQENQRLADASLKPIITEEDYDPDPFDSYFEMRSKYFNN